MDPVMRVLPPLRLLLLGPYHLMETLTTLVCPRPRRASLTSLHVGSLLALIKEGKMLEREKDRIWHTEKCHKIEKCQKELCAEANIPHSPLSEPTVFDPPSPIENPWADLGSWVPVDDDNEDFGGGEFVGDDEEATEDKN
jgi:hypothetical protein